MGKNVTTPKQVGTVSYVVNFYQLSSMTRFWLPEERRSTWQLLTQVILRIFFSTTQLVYMTVSPFFNYSDLCFEL